ncbi:MAG: rnaseph: ribonuclease ph [Verrucomicrobiales bacterium]|nr:rnaseph: ribonuclease ph [Verrucomicrobiales bacterium]
MIRPDGRQRNQCRPITFIPNIAPQATGSVLSCFGSTQVICTVMVEEGVPFWMKQQGISGGWLTAEYSMLPASTSPRKPRDISKGKLDGRSTEIQRLIGRALRSVTDLSVLGQRTVWIDCDVLTADGGTRTAAITGAAVACAIAFNKLVAAKKLFRSPLTKLVAAVSAGIYENEAVLDLNYLEDKDASVDFNFVITENGEFVEIQGAGEESTFTEQQFAELMVLGKQGIAELITLQRQAIEAAGEALPADPGAAAHLAAAAAKANPVKSPAAQAPVPGPAPHPQQRHQQHQRQAPSHGRPQQQHPQNPPGGRQRPVSLPPPQSGNNPLGDLANFFEKR